jgi:hypothetical protein
LIGSAVRHMNRILREARGGGNGIVIVHCIAMLSYDVDKPLAQLWIGRLRLLGKGWQSKADCQPY